MEGFEAEEWPLLVPHQSLDFEMNLSGMHLERERPEEGTNSRALLESRQKVARPLDASLPAKTPYGPSLKTKPNQRPIVY